MRLFLEMSGKNFIRYELHDTNPSICRNPYNHLQLSWGIDLNEDGSKRGGAFLVIWHFLENLDCK
jgi:hypothetical protein